MSDLDQAFLAAIVDTTDDAVIGKTINGIILSWNKAAQEMYGYSREEMIGQSIAVLLPSEYAHEVSEILGRIKRGERVAHYETRRLTKNGVEIDVSLTVSPIKDSSGNIIGASTIARNITEQKQTAQALRQSDEMLRSIFENSLDGVLLTAPDGRVFKANPAACRILGHTEEAICRIARDGLVDQSDIRMGMLLEERKGQGYAKGELNFVRAGGAAFPVEISSAIFTDSKGEQKTCIIFRDITRRKDMEEERNRLITELQESLSKVKKLSGLLPICASCKKIRDDKGYWQQIETYIHTHSEADFSHGICPECAKKFYAELYKEKLDPDREP
jgi:PAS domain S-box-containing protein